MLSSEDTAKRCFFGGSGEARERAFHPGENFRRNVELDTVPVEKGNQHLRPGSTYDRMSSWIGWVGGGLADFWKPIRISHCFRVVIGISSPNRRHWSPEIVCVFGVVEGDHVIGKTQVHQREQPRTLRRRQTVRQRGRLRNLVPIILNSPVPKPPGQCLIGRGGRAVNDSNRLDLVESIAVRIAGQRRGRTGPELARALQRKRGYARPMCELRLGRKIRRCRLVISRGGPENIRNRLGIRAVVASQCQNAIRNGLSYTDTFHLVVAIRNLCQGLQ